MSKRDRNKRKQKGAQQPTKNSYEIISRAQVEIVHKLSPSQAVELQRVASRAQNDAIQQWLALHVDGNGTLHELDRVEYVVVDGGQSPRH